MSELKLSRMERETIIRRADDEECWDVFSESPVMLRKLERFQGRDGVSFERISDTAYQYRLPMNAVRIVVPRQVSEAEMARRREAGRALHANKESK